MHFSFDENKVCKKVLIKNKAQASLSKMIFTMEHISPKNLVHFLTESQQNVQKSNKVKKTTKITNIIYKVTKSD